MSWFGGAAEEKRPEADGDGFSHESRRHAGAPFSKESWMTAFKGLMGQFGDALEPDETEAAQKRKAKLATSVLSAFKTTVKTDSGAGKKASFMTDDTDVGRSEKSGPARAFSKSASASPSRQRPGAAAGHSAGGQNSVAGARSDRGYNSFTAPGMVGGQAPYGQRIAPAGASFQGPDAYGSFNAPQFITPQIQGRVPPAYFPTGPGGPYMQQPGYGPSPGWQPQQPPRGMAYGPPPPAYAHQANVVPVLAMQAPDYGGQGPPAAGAVMPVAPAAPAIAEMRPEGPNNKWATGKPAVALESLPALAPPPQLQPAQPPGAAAAASPVPAPAAPVTHPASPAAAPAAGIGGGNRWAHAAAIALPVAEHRAGADFVAVALAAAQAAHVGQSAHDAEATSGGSKQRPGEATALRLERERLAAERAERGASNKPALQRVSSIDSYVGVAGSSGQPYAEPSPNFADDASEAASSVMTDAPEQDLGDEEDEDAASGVSVADTLPVVGYLPEGEALDSTWKPPALEFVSEADARTSRLQNAVVASSPRVNDLVSREGGPGIAAAVFGSAHDNPAQTAPSARTMDDAAGASLSDLRQDLNARLPQLPSDAAILGATASSKEPVGRRPSAAVGHAPSVPGLQHQASWVSETLPSLPEDESEPEPEPESAAGRSTPAPPWPVPALPPPTDARDSPIGRSAASSFVIKPNSPQPQQRSAAASRAGSQTSLASSGPRLGAAAVMGGGGLRLGAAAALQEGASSQAVAPPRASPRPSANGNSFGRLNGEDSIRISRVGPGVRPTNGSAAAVSAVPPESPAAAPKTASSFFSGAGAK